MLDKNVNICNDFFLSYACCFLLLLTFHKQYLAPAYQHKQQQMAHASTAAWRVFVASMHPMTMSQHSILLLNSVHG
jgi:hypothetical protein